MKVLVVNCGSSSIKVQLFQLPKQKVLAKGLVERIGDEDSSLLYEHAGRTQRRPCPIQDHGAGMTILLEALSGRKPAVLQTLDEIGAVGHRVVHGGEAFTESVPINDAVLTCIERFAKLAPLHNPPNLTGIHVTRQKLPHIPHIACFDTAFHTTIPPVAFHYAIPRELYEKYGIRRYGFHGTSHRYVVQRAAALLGRDNQINCITCHLGNGCSITAVKEGRSVDTSMGFTPLEGLIMGTRSGDLDPAILFYLAAEGYEISSLNELCNKQSGLLGLSGESNDMRTLLSMAQQGHERARLAIDVFCYRIKKYLGAYAAVLGKVDAVVFTGGIGENAAEIRERVCRRMEHPALVLEPARNEATTPKERQISAAESKVKVLVIPTDEEATIAADTYQIAKGFSDLGSKAAPQD